MSGTRKYSLLRLKPGIVVSILLLVVLIAGCSQGFTSAQGGTVPSAAAQSAPKVATSSLVQSSDGGSVTVEARWLAEKTDSVVFDVVMNTHSVNLDGFDLKALSVLRDDQSNVYSPVSWNAPEGGHHRNGKLTFPRPDSLSQGKTKFIELVIRDVAVKERVLQWQTG